MAAEALNRSVCTFARLDESPLQYSNNLSLLVFRYYGDGDNNESPFYK